MPRRLATVAGALESEVLLVGGKRMHARVALRHAPAHAPTIVLVHGLGVSSRYMQPLARTLAPLARVFAPDLPGFGRSEADGVPPTTAHLAAALAAYLEARRIERATFVGNSYGCEILAELGRTAPGLFERAVFIGSTTDTRAHRALVQVLRWVRDGLFEPPSLLPVVFRDYLAAGTRRCVRTYRLMLENHIERVLPELHFPVLVVRGANDPIAPRPWAEEMVRLLPHGRAAVIPGAAHATNFSAPLELTRIIRGFLRVERPDDCPRCLTPVARRERTLEHRAC